MHLIRLLTRSDARFKGTPPRRRRRTTPQCAPASPAAPPQQSAAARHRPCHCRLAVPDEPDGDGRNGRAAQGPARAVDVEARCPESGCSGTRSSRWPTVWRILTFANITLARLPPTQRGIHQAAQGPGQRVRAAVRAVQDAPDRELPATRLHHQPAVATARNPRRDSPGPRWRRPHTQPRRTLRLEPGTPIAA